jgi:glyoxylate/hydroxypyruvate reductase
MKVVFNAPGTRPEPWVGELAQLLPEAEVFDFQVSDARSADYAVVWTPDVQLFEKHRQLRAIFNLGAGVDALMRMANLPPAVPVVRLGDAGMSVQMAEFVCQAVIRFAREIDVFEAGMVRREWRYRKPTAREDYPVGVMGLGVIGAAVARALAYFEYPVAGWSRSKKTIADMATYAGESEFKTFLQRTRVLVCVLPLTAETEGIICRDTLAEMKPGGLLINVGRGNQVVEADVLAMLESGQLAHAVLDVFRDEPLPPEHAYWGHPKITMTPHISARTLRGETLAQIAAKIRAHAAGKAIDGIVDRALGY